MSASILGAATVAWGLFEVAEYHFRTLACYGAMIAMLTFFVWTNASALLNLYCTFFFSLTVLFQTIVSYRTFGLWFSAIVHFSKFFQPMQSKDDHLIIRLSEHQIGLLIIQI